MSTLKDTPFRTSLLSRRRPLTRSLISMKSWWIWQKVFTDSKSHLSGIKWSKLKQKRTISDLFYLSKVQSLWNLLNCLLNWKSITKLKLKSRIREGSMVQKYLEEIGWSIESIFLTKLLIKILTFLDKYFKNSWSVDRFLRMIKCCKRTIG
jgi:hypothetical protein